jgi:putative membrane protein
MLRLTLAALHLFALGIGLGGIWGRARALGSHSLDRATVRRAFTADSWWGVAAIFWLVTGLWRLLAGTEKVTSYYTHNTIFMGKMALFVTILLLELWPMITLIRWRAAEGRGREVWQPDQTAAHRISRISYIQVALLLMMLVAAVSMARGYGSEASR